MRKYFQGSTALWLLTGAMAAVSMLVIASASMALGYRSGSLFIPWVKHVAMLVMALAAMYVIHRIDYSKVAVFIPRLLFWGAVGLLLSTLAFGVEINEARRWIRLPGVGLQIQSSDIARLVLVLYLAYQLAIKGDIDGEHPSARAVQKVAAGIWRTVYRLCNAVVRRIQGMLQSAGKASEATDAAGAGALYVLSLLVGLPLVLPMSLAALLSRWMLRMAEAARFRRWAEALIRFLLPIALIVGLILPADLSTAALTALTAFLLLFAAGFPSIYLFGSGLLAAGILALFLWVGPELGIERAATWQRRIELMTSGDPGYQATQAMVALYRGGLAGTGPGGSILRNFLPNAFSDYVYAIIVEEYGWAGMLIIWGFFIAFFFIGLRIANNAPGAFGRYLALGLTLHIVLQAVFHILVNVGIFPVTGLTLPLISMGGTSIIITGVALGLIQSVARTAAAMPPAHPEPSAPKPTQLTPTHA